MSRGLKLVEILADAGELPLAEIARRADLSKSSAHRLLQTLIQADFVTQAEPSGHYRLGMRLLRLASSYVAASGLEELVLPVLSALAASCHETVHMALLDGEAAVYVAKIDSPNAIRMYSRVGRPVPYYCTGLGKAILGHLPEARALDLLGREPLHQHTPNTITDLLAWRAHLALIRSRGYALDEEEHERGIRCIAAPVFGRDHRVAGAISITGLTFRVSLEQLLAWWPQLRDCAQQVSTILEFHFP